MTFEAKINAFEGPLDLLLHLLEKNKIDIYDIPISTITDQYLEYVRQMERADSDVMSEFLVMAATLLDIKAKMMLPKEVDEDGEEEDPRAELVQQLLEYKLYKYMSVELKDRAVIASHSLYRKENIPEEVRAYEPPINLDEFLGDLTIVKMKQIFDDVIARSNEKVNFQALEFGNIQREEIKIEDRIDEIKNRIKNEKISFRKLVGEHLTKANIIVTFLAVLELMKSGELVAVQENMSNDIILQLPE